MSINIAFLAIWFLLFTIAFNRPELIPLFMAFQAALNLFMFVLFTVDKKKNLATAFGIGFGIVVILCATGFFLLNKYVHLIKADEMFTG